VGKPEEKRPLEKLRCRREVNIIVDQKEIGWGGIKWIHLALGRDQWRAVVNPVMDLHVSYHFGKFLSI
jgi:hypothetical protein